MLLTPSFVPLRIRNKTFYSTVKWHYKWCCATWKQLDFFQTESLPSDPGPLKV